MTEANPRSQFEQDLVARAWQDDAFRQKLINDPSGTVREAVDFDLPSDADIKVIEEPEGSLYVVLPAAPKTRELSERELDAAAGGSGNIFHTAFGTTCSIPAFYCC